jgi:hypothetical protein
VIIYNTAQWGDTICAIGTLIKQTTVYKIVLMNGGAAEYEAVLKEYTSTDDNQVS